MRLFIPITKVTERSDGSCDLYGIAASEAQDDVKEIFDYDSSKPYFQAWSDAVSKATDGKSLGNIRAMHSKLAAGKATQLVFDDANKAIHLASHIVDLNEARKCLEGVYSGYSIGGSYERRWPDTNQRGAYRYTAKPSEVSIVDIPANPEATFALVKMDGSSTIEKFAKPDEDRLIRAFEYVATKQAEVFGDMVKSLRDSTEKMEVNVNKEEGKTQASIEAQPTTEVDTKVGGEDEMNKGGVKHLVTDADGTKHLPVTGEDGKPDHNHMGAAWAALHGGYRGNKYEGPNKDKAIADLKAMYESEGMPLPTEKRGREEEDDREEDDEEKAALGKTITSHLELAQYVHSEYCKRCTVPAPKDLNLDKAKKFAKSLSDVASLASIIQQLGFMQECLRGEKAWEGDASEAPTKLHAILQTLSTFLLELAGEELSELTAAAGGTAAEVNKTTKEVALMKATIKAIEKVANGATDEVKKAFAPHLKALNEHVEKIHKAGMAMGDCLKGMGEAHDAMGEEHEKMKGHHEDMMKAASALVGSPGGPEMGGKVAGDVEVEGGTTHEVSTNNEGETMAGEEGAMHKMISSGFAALEKRLGAASTKVADEQKARIDALEKGQETQLKVLNALLKAMGASDETQSANTTGTITRVEKGAGAGATETSAETNTDLPEARKSELLKKAQDGTINEREKRELFKSVPLTSTIGKGPAPHLRLER